MDGVRNTRSLSLRSLYGIVFAAMFALSLVSATTQALAATQSRGGAPGSAFFDPGIAIRVDELGVRRPLIGLTDGIATLLGVTWE